LLLLLFYYTIPLYARPLLCIPFDKCIYVYFYK
jgi:hypothetical protein